jgi:hypothetical protein
MLDEYITFSAVFTTPDFSPPYTADWNWGDASSSSCPHNSAACTLLQSRHSVTGSHSYTEPGVFAVQLTVTDFNGGSGEPVFQYVVAYDPTGGFVTGSGWIDSPPGACNFGACTQDTIGKATFGFVSKYKKGKSTPDGNTQFQFMAGDLDFHSDSYDWLVVNQNDSNAQFKGSGTINGAGDYKFMLWAGDRDPDTFRIKIWVGDDEDNPVYDIHDNGVAQPIGGGSIVVRSTNDLFLSYILCRKADPASY